MTYRLVIFDFDGTLGDSGDWFISIFNSLAERFRFKMVSREEMEALRAQGAREVLRHLGIPRWKLPFIARHLRGLAAGQADQIKLFPGTTAMFETLAAAGVRIALVTSNSEANVRRTLGPAILKHIEWLEGGSSLFGKATKFRRVLRKSGIAPRHALAIGDETRDGEAARKVGIDFGAVVWGYATEAAMAAFDPDALFRSPEEIAPFVLGHHAASPGAEHHVKVAAG